MRMNPESKKLFRSLLTATEYEKVEAVVKLQTKETIADERPILLAMRAAMTPLCMPLFHNFDKPETAVLPCVWVVVPQSHLMHFYQLLIGIEEIVQASRLKITPMLNVRSSDELDSPSKIPGWLSLKLQFGADYRGGEFCHPDPDDMHYLALLWSWRAGHLSGPILPPSTP